MRKLAAEKAALTSELESCQRQVAELRAAVGVLAQANETLETKLAKEKDKTSKAKDASKAAAADAKEAARQWAAERQKLKALEVEVGAAPSTKLL